MWPEPISSQDWKTTPPLDRGAEGTSINAALVENLDYISFICWGLSMCHSLLTIKKKVIMGQKKSQWANVLRKGQNACPSTVHPTELVFCYITTQVCVLRSLGAPFWKKSLLLSSFSCGFSWLCWDSGELWTFSTGHCVLSNRVGGTFLALEWLSYRSRTVASQRPD